MAQDDFVQTVPFDRVWPPIIAADDTFSEIPMVTVAVNPRVHKRPLNKMSMSKVPDLILRMKYKMEM